MADRAASSAPADIVRAVADSVAGTVAGVVRATDSLYASIDRLTDDQVRQPSLLPGWTRGHVLTHIARNADALVNLVTWAATGVETPMYPSRDHRAADIEAGAGRSADELVADVHQTSDRLLAELDRAPDEAWHRRVRFGSRDVEVGGDHIPFLRLVEVEVHHVDLDLDYTLARLPEDFVERMLDDLTADYGRDDERPGMVLVSTDDEHRWTIHPGGTQVSGPPPALLGWLLGRTDGAGLHSDEPLPTPGVWR
jgi:maleylpyruvate isomerase